MRCGKLGWIAALAVMTGVGTASAAEVQLKAASFLPARLIFAKFFYDWVDSVNKTCAGEVEISVVGPEAINSLEQWNAVKTGVVDMHYGPANYYKGTMPEASVTDVATNESAEQRENGAWEMLNDLYNEKMNVQYLTQIIDGVHFYLYTNKPAQDGRFEGFRLRSVPVYDNFFKWLGAQPVRMAPPEVYTALERRVIDGYGWPLWGVVGFGWHKHTKYRYGPGFLNASVNILANLDKWKSMSDDQRACLTERAEWLETVWPEWRDEQTEKEAAALEEAGIEYVDLGEEFSEKAAELYWADLRSANPEFIDKIRPLVTK